MAPTTLPFPEKVLPDRYPHALKLVTESPHMTHVLFKLLPQHWDSE